MNPLRRPTNATPAEKAAERFLVSKGARSHDSFDPEGTLQILALCADHLVATLQLDPLEARDQALRSWSEIIGREAQAYIDLEASTQFMVVVVDPLAGDVRRAIPVVDLLRLLGPRAVA